MQRLNLETGYMNKIGSLLLLALLPFTALSLCAQEIDGDNEIAWAGGVTAVFQLADDDRVDPELTASADLFITIPRTAGEWLIYIEGSTSPDKNGVSALYPTANADAGSVLNEDGDGGIQISEFNYTFRLNDDRSLMVGLINPSAWLDRSRIANDENQHYLNGSFKNNATIDFPDYTFGAVFRWPGSKSRPEVSLVISSSDGKADMPDRSYQDLLKLTSDERGAFLGFGASWLRDSTSLRVGAWLRSDDHAVAGNPDESEKNYGVYGVLGWQRAANAVNIRLGLANEDVSVATRFAAIAYQRQIRSGLLGIGVARTVIANNFRQGNLENTSAAEVFYRIPLGQLNGHITPSFQYVENPGFDASGPTASSSAVVAGVRFHWAF